MDKKNMKKPKILEYLLVLSLCLSLLPSFAAGIDIITSDNYADLGVAQVLGAKISGKVVKLGWGEAAKTGAEKMQITNETYILGGVVALPALAGSGELSQAKTKFLGKDRYETASLAALLWSSSESIVIAYGYDEEGIENAKSVAITSGAPLLLVSQKELTGATENAVDALKPKKAFLVSSPDMIQNYIISSLKTKGVEVELVQQNHREKTLKLMEKANSAINLSKNLQNESDVAKLLIAEAERELLRALEYYNLSLYNYAFEQASFARYNAETAEKIKRGIIKITFTLPPAREENKALNETLKIADVLLNPQGYEGKKVKLSGAIEEAIEIKSIAYLKIFDGTGRIMVTFSATKEFILSKGWLFMIEQDIIGKEIEVEGVVKINVPISPHGEPTAEHGAFAYLIYAENIKLKKEK